MSVILPVIFNQDKAEIKSIDVRGNNIRINYACKGWFAWYLDSDEIEFVNKCLDDDMNETDLIVEFNKRFR